MQNYPQNGEECIKNVDDEFAIFSEKGTAHGGDGT